MKIKHFGYNGPVSCMETLNKALVECGAELVEDGPVDLILDIHGFPTEAIEYSKKYPGSKKIFGLLNADINNPDWPEEQAKREMAQADVRVTVAQSCADDLKKRTGMDYEVIYFPMKPIGERQQEIKSNNFLWVGRWMNPEKRFRMAVQAITFLGEDPHNMKIVGPEQCQGFNNAGFVDEYLLDRIYNQSAYLLAPCSHEGPMAMLEAACAWDCIPVMCDDNLWAHEFGFLEFCSTPYAGDFARKIIEIDKNRNYYENLLRELRPSILDKFSTKRVAERIVAIYERIKV